MTKFILIAGFLVNPLQIAYMYDFVDPVLFGKNKNMCAVIISGGEDTFKKSGKRLNDERSCEKILKIMEQTNDN